LLELQADNETVLLKLIVTGN